jgi:putative tricarboxylic transport membrane protein
MKIKVKYRDRAISVFLIVVFGFFYYMTLSFPNSINSYPDALCLAGIALCLMLLVSTFVLKKYRTGENSFEVQKIQLFRLIASVALVAIYIILFDKAGYILSTLFFLTAQMWLLRPSFKKTSMILIAVVATGIMFFVFSVILHVSLATLVL